MAQPPRPIKHAHLPLTLCAQPGNAAPANHPHPPIRPRALASGHEYPLCRFPATIARHCCEHMATVGQGLDHPTTPKEHRWRCLGRSEEHTSELQSRPHLITFPTRRSSDLSMRSTGERSTSEPPASSNSPKSASIRP